MLECFQLYTGVWLTFCSILLEKSCRQESFFAACLSVVFHRIKNRTHQVSVTLKMCAGLDNILNNKLLTTGDKNSPLPGHLLETKSALFAVLDYRIYISGLSLGKLFAFHPLGSFGKILLFSRCVCVLCNHWLSVWSIVRSQSVTVCCVLLNLTGLLGKCEVTLVSLAVLCFLSEIVLAIVFQKVEQSSSTYLNLWLKKSCPGSILTSGNKERENHTKKSLLSKTGTLNAHLMYFYCPHTAETWTSWQTVELLCNEIMSNIQ